MEVNRKAGCGRFPQKCKKNGRSSKSKKTGTGRDIGKNIAESKDPEKQKQAFRQEENRIRKARSSFDPRAEPVSCQRCNFYQPNFRYRHCFYSQCPYGKKEDIFRKKPLKGKGGNL